MRATLAGAVLSMVVLLPQVGNAQESAAWMYTNEPISVGGLIYYPTASMQFFDSNAMSQLSTYRGVPVYEHALRQPFSLVYVPVGRGLVRAYERRAEPVGGVLEPAPVGTSGERIPAPLPMTSSGTPAPAGPTRTHVESVPRPSAASGIWIEFSGARWYASGPPVRLEEKRFQKIGEYRGFPVYRDKNADSDRIWVRITQDGPVAPYSRR